MKTPLTSHRTTDHHTMLSLPSHLTWSATNDLVFSLRLYPVFRQQAPKWVRPWSLTHRRPIHLRLQPCLINHPPTRPRTSTMRSIITHVVQMFPWMDTSILWTLCIPHKPTTLTTLEPCQIVSKIVGLSVVIEQVFDVRL